MDLDLKIKQTLEKHRQITLAAHHLAELEKRLDTARRQLGVLEHALDREYANIEELEKLGIKQLFLRVLGEREQQLEIKRQEYLQAILRHKDLLKSIELMEFEKKVLEEKIETLPALASKLDQLLQRREQQLLIQKDHARHTIIKINHRIDKAVALKREIYEAKIVGAKVKVLLQRMINLLTKAATKNKWQSTSHVQHNNHPEVQAALDTFYEMKQRLLEFEDELHDIYHHRNIKFSEGSHAIDQLTRLYYDNLISDWIIRKKIHHSLYQIETLNDKILRTLQSLEQEEQQANVEIEELENKKKDLLTT